MNTEEKARLFAQAVTNSVEKGIRHYHPRTDALLATPKEILECMLEEGRVTVEAPRTCSRRHLCYDRTRTLCGECGLELVEIWGD